MRTSPLDRPAPEILDDLTRREFIGGGLAALLLAGCSRTTEESGTQGPPQAGFPVTIEHMFGSTEIPDEPQRIATVGYVDQDAVLALGFVPVAARDWTGERSPLDYPWQQGPAGGASAEVIPFDLDYEQLAAVRPDLIVAIWAGITAEEYGLLSQIAPTVAHAAEFAADPFLAPWRDRTRMTGRMLGREERAVELIGQVEARFAEVRRRHPQFEGATLALAEGPIEGNVVVYTPTNPRGLIIEALGFTAPAGIAGLDDGTGVVRISQEQLELVDQDVLLWIGSDPAMVRQMPLHGQLKAVQEGREVFADNLVLSALSYGSVLSLPYALDRLGPLLAAAVDGNPATEVPAA
ncbi:MAG: iron-siderophore ABC transporter substrate-binding protein [Actinomycetota bacterium]